MGSIVAPMAVVIRQQPSVLGKSLLTNLLRLGFSIFLLTGPVLSDELSFQQTSLETGDAVFSLKTGGLPYGLWTVKCSRPSHDCAASAPGWRIRINAEDLPILSSPFGTGARISVQNKNFTIAMPHLLSVPLSLDDIDWLSRPDTFLLIEDQAGLKVRQPTQYLDRVIAYLIWVNSPEAQNPSNSFELREYNYSNDEHEQQLFQHGAQHVLSPELKRYRQLVPADKPQSEFAIRSQGGRSFFTKTGRAGY